MEKNEFILEYIKKLEDDINRFYDFNISENQIFDDIRETFIVFSKELPEIEQSVLFRSGSSINDTNITINLLKKYLIDNGYCEEKLDNNYEALNKMWVFFEAYIKDKINNDYSFFDKHYLDYDYDKYGNFLDVKVKINFNNEFKLNYGIDMDFSNFKITFDNIRKIIELTYTKLIDKKCRYKYTIDINDAFEKFRLSYRIKDGIVFDETYKTSYLFNSIIDEDKFEDKINRSNQLIVSPILLDKKAAVKYLVDAIEYLISIQNGTAKKEKEKNMAIRLSANLNTKKYSVIFKEIDDIMKFSNDYFDIRHNDKKLESLNDPKFIEYLYNRIYALIMLYRINVSK